MCFFYLENLITNLKIAFNVNVIRFFCVEHNELDQYASRQSLL